MDKPPWTKNSQFASLLSRKKNEDELDKLLEGWTVNYPPEVIMNLLQDRGIAAGLVENGSDLHNDPQLKACHHFWLLDHPEMGRCAYSAPPYTLSETPAKLRMPAPRLGEHTEYVCTKILGMSDEQFAELFNAGTFE